ncbi:dihydrolipoyl dehydrogenase [Algimonas ampicilliniresistens]|uniref:Dihydrolipoyl dehydrogenase n=1 Tax=Algimonas ampicilliniresistens TaxID=1298735 RepID=A0ABQ5V6E6_9PROT|nr:dihydrolipoyl dehydrogenase [Algimonas ampicilliniresistens]GLQ22577.1 dihydrolipoyl dehydrogenase [Algimonas ampicilliniresistens]
MADIYDVIIIGGGPGGYNCAIRCGQLGLKVACIETRKTLGGTCLNVGCIPSKALLHATELYETAGKDFAAMGMSAKVSADVPKMIEAKDKVVTGLTAGIEYLFKKNKVDHIRGFGKIVGKGKVDVDGKTYDTKNIVIATGSEVASLPFIKIDEKKVVSSTGALELQSVPKSMIVIGGGVIGLELGSVWRRLGAEVTVIEYLPQILPGMDEEIRKTSARIFKKQGMKFELGRKVTAVDGKGKTVKIESEAAAGGKEKSFEADVVLVAIGRKPFTDNLGLDTVSIKTTDRGFIPTDHWKAAEGIYAVGDVIEGPMLAHLAEEEGVAVAETIAGQSGHVNYNAIPGVVYTFPEIATVGKTEEELKEAGVPYKVGKFPLTANSRARCNHETDGLAKILAHAETDEILGGHIIAPGAGDMIHEICLGLEFKASSEDIARTCHAHPTLSEAVRQAAMDVEGWAMQM